MAVMYLRDQDGKFVTVRTIKGAPGKTPVKGTDYWTDEDREGIIADVTHTAVAKQQGSENVGKILVVGADGNLTLTNMPEPMSGDVVGVLDSNNNIVITGSLAEGTYVFRYADTDGTYSDIGTLTVGNGGAYTNLADTSADAGWLNDKRFSTSSSNTETIKASSSRGVITNYIAVAPNKILRAKGLNFINAVGDVTPVAAAYTADRAFRTLVYLNSEAGGKYDENTHTSEVTLSSNVSDGEYIRISGTLVDGYAAGDVIITLDQAITD